jgi:imidazole glycerol-phosphate synthase subunit HisH
MKVALVSYGMGNLASVRRALEELGAHVLLAEHPAALFEADRVVLPGVGAYGECMTRLSAAGFADPIRRIVGEGRPLLGICVGMQMLADAGEEYGEHRGLGLVGGRVRRLDDLGCRLRLPHMGWNGLDFDEGNPLFAGLPQGADVYFVHSYGFDPSSINGAAATTDYGVPVVAAVRSRNVFGTQFHPEKSSSVGRRLLANFLSYRPC